MCRCNSGKQAAAAAAAAGAPAPRPVPRPAMRPAARMASAPVVAAAAAPAPVAIEASLPIVDTSIWGPPLWQVLHTASVFTRNRRQIDLWRALVAALKTGLPCPDCSAHYNAWTASHILRFSMVGDGIREPVIRWFLTLHNDVNQRLPTPVGPWTIQQVMNAYGGDRTARLVIAMSALQSLQGIIGDAAYWAAMALLHSLT